MYIIYIHILIFKMKHIKYFFISVKFHKSLTFFFKEKLKIKINFSN